MAIQSALRGSVIRRELRHKHSVAEYVQRHMRMLLVRRRLDRMNFAAYQIQGWYRQHRQTWTEKLLQRTKRRAGQVFANVAKKVFAKPKIASKKVASFLRRKAKEPHPEPPTQPHPEPPTQTKKQNIFQKTGGFFARIFRSKKKQEKKTAVQPLSVEEAFQRRMQLLESKADTLGVETKITEAEPPENAIPTGTCKCLKALHWLAMTPSLTTSL